MARSVGSLVLEAGSFRIEASYFLDTFEPFFEWDIIQAQTVVWLQREYVWGPDDLDECLFQLNNIGNPAYCLLDGNLSVVALTRGWAGNGLNVGDIMEQYVWSPYGELLAKEHFGAATVQNPVGFQGLMFIRLDGLNTDPALVASSYDFDSAGTILSRTWRGWFYARNRLYEPVLGRFTSKDPHVTGLLMRSQTSLLSGELPTSISPFDPELLFGDGMSLYAFCRNQPNTHRDPLGANAVNTAYGVAGGPVVYAPQAGGYLLGQLWAQSLGFGPGTLSGIGNMWMERWGPGWYEGTWSGVGRWAIQDVAGQFWDDIAELGARAAFGQSGAFSFRLFLEHGTRRLRQELSGFAAYTVAAPVLFGAGLYVGVIDSVIWSVEQDMSHSQPNASDWGPSWLFW